MTQAENLNLPPRLQCELAMADAFRKLEYSISEALSVSVLAESYVTNNLKPSNAHGDWCGIPLYALNDEQSDGIVFSVMHLGNMVRKLHAEWHAACDEAHKLTKSEG